MTDREKIHALLQELQDALAERRRDLVDDSVCGLCEYDAPMNEAGDGMIGGDCPGFYCDDCFRMQQSYIDKFLPGEKLRFPEIYEEIE